MQPSDIPERVAVLARDIACGSPFAGTGERRTYTPQMPTVETMKAAIAAAMNEIAKEQGNEADA